jgi:perosamine synthetase
MYQENSSSLYENQIEQFFGIGARAFAFWKGRVALYAILKAMEVGSGSEVIIPGYTCVVVANAVRLTGAEPVYVDIAPDSYNMDPGKVREAITSRTKVILLQHTYGIPACFDDIYPLTIKEDIKIIEDCAHAFGTIYNGKHLGLQGNAAFFSSQWSKPYTTGLGGLALTREPELANKLKKLQKEFHQPTNFSQLRLLIQYLAYQLLFSPRLYWQAQGLLRYLSRFGFCVGSSNERELQGSLPEDHEWLMGRFQQQFGMNQQKRAYMSQPKRCELARFYDQGLSRSGFSLASCPNEAILLRYPVRVRNKLELLEKARCAQIELGSWFESPLHPISLPNHVLYGYTVGQCPNSELATRQVVNLPMHDRVTKVEAERVLSFFVDNAIPA